jgi:imidazole glycerol-phosphate synthase subunit HisH
VPDVAVIDYGMGNLDSIRRALEECGGAVTVTDQPDEIQRCDRIVLPGVGAFPDGMANLRQRGLDTFLRREVVDLGLPFLGICLGMQLLFGTGFEVHETAGLGWFDGEVRRLEPRDSERLPHVGWNSLSDVRDCPLLAGLSGTEDFYFVHSFHCRPRDPAVIRARSDYCGGFAAVVGRGNLYGVQFHPEKSQKAGFRVLRNFLSL